MDFRDFKIHYGGLLLRRLLWPWGTRLTTPFPPQTSDRFRFRCTATDRRSVQYLRVFSIMDTFDFILLLYVKGLINDHDFLLLCWSYISQNFIPANFFSVKCERFFVSTKSEFPKIYWRLPKIAEDFGRFRKTSEDRQRFPTSSKDLPTTTEDGQQRFPKDFQPISNIVKESRRCSNDFLNVEKTIEFLFDRFLSNYTRYCQLGVRN